MRWVWSKHFEIHLILPLAWNEFHQHNLRCFFVLSGMGRVWSTHVEMHFASSLIWEGFCKTCLDEFSALARIGGVWSTSRDSFCVLASLFGVWSTQFENTLCPRRHVKGLRYILFPRWHGMSFVKNG